MRCIYVELYIYYPIYRCDEVWYNMRMSDYEPTIRREDLINGAYYYGVCRNASVARWNEEYGVFIYRRTKFGDTFLETIKCPEDEVHYDVFVAERLLYPADIEPDMIIEFNGSEYNFTMGISDS